MKTTHIEDWNILKNLLPTHWELLAKETGANRRLRNFKSVESLMRTLLLHVGLGYSLRETVVRAKMGKIAEISDVALLKRLRSSGEWLKELSLRLLQEQGVELPKIEGVRLRLIDGTIVKEPGKTGSQWRLHYSFSLPDLCCDYFNLTPTIGEGTAESFQQIPIKKNDYIVGDRAYSNAPGIWHVHNHGGYVLVRLNTAALPLFERKGKSFNLLKALKKIPRTGQIGEWDVCVEHNGKLVKGRICAIKKTKQAIQVAQRKIKRRSSKNQVKTKPLTLEYAKYVIVFTTFPKQTFDATQILECYRLRWQIELYFKRIKSLAQLGHLPKYDKLSSKAWLYGKLLVALLTEKLIRNAEKFFPWGYKIQYTKTKNAVA
jgi:hypothetical protein